LREAQKCRLLKLQIYTLNGNSKLHGEERWTLGVNFRMLASVTRMTLI